MPRPTEANAFIADDGTVCNTKEEMLEVNRRVDLAFLPDKLWRIFGQFQAMETHDWFYVNVLRKTHGSLCEISRRLYKHAVKG